MKILLNTVHTIWTFLKQLMDIKSVTVIRLWTGGLDLSSV